MNDFTPEEEEEVVYIVLGLDRKSSGADMRPRFGEKMLGAKRPHKETEGCIWWWKGVCRQGMIPV